MNLYYPPQLWLVPSRLNVNTKILCLYTVIKLCSFLTMLKLFCISTSFVFCLILTKLFFNAKVYLLLLGNVL